VTKSLKATQNWVAMSDKRQGLFFLKYINFFLQIIKKTFQLGRTFRTKVFVNFARFSKGFAKNFANFAQKLEDENKSKKRNRQAPFRYETERCYGSLRKTEPQL
jgi:hypothetical protein